MFDLRLDASLHQPFRWLRNYCSVKVMMQHKDHNIGMSQGQSLVLGHNHALELGQNHDMGLGQAQHDDHELDLGQHQHDDHHELGLGGHNQNQDEEDHHHLTIHERE
ncbi:Uncharacterized protein Rs2_25920 [Raphanus sativus]|nr:Uncharacterized protein Rs2_25920 [Raphanus sativus]